jgi:alpha-L-rhamnosidase
MNFSHDSVSGTYVSNWRINEDGTVTVHFEVPFNCTATAVLSGTEGEELELQSGVFERTYRSQRDYRKLYTMNSRLEELQQDERACLQQHDAPPELECVLWTGGRWNPGEQI